MTAIDVIDLVDDLSRAPAQDAVAGEPTSDFPEIDMTAGVPGEGTGSAGGCVQLVLCLDGTNNTLTGRERDTNVLKCHEYLSRHALSLDEHRMAFRPRLYEEDDFGTAEDGQSLRQRWFRGAHADVSGGYATNESGLSDSALSWMLEEAHACGLGAGVDADSRPKPAPGAGDIRAARRKAHDPVHSVPWWAATGLMLRDARRAHRDSPAVRPVEHDSVAEPVPESIWNERRSWAPLILAALGWLLLLRAHGRFLMGLDDWGLDPVQAGLDLLMSLPDAGRWWADGWTRTLAAFSAWRDLQARQMAALWEVPRALWTTFSLDPLRGTWASPSLERIEGAMAANFLDPAPRADGFLPLLWHDALLLWMAGVAWWCKTAGFVGCLSMGAAGLFVGRRRLAPAKQAGAAGEADRAPASSSPPDEAPPPVDPVEKLPPKAA